MPIFFGELSDKDRDPIREVLSSMSGYTPQLLQQLIEQLNLDQETGLQLIGWWFQIDLKNLQNEL